MRASTLRAYTAAAAVLLLAGCSSAGAASAPTWQPKPSFSGENINPGNSGNGGSAPSGGPRQPGGSSVSGSGTSKLDPFVVATKLTSPTGVVVLPDNTALVGERTTGRIVRVQPVAGKPVTTVRTITGLTVAGGGGLMDLALSPNYAQDNLIFAYLSTATDNRVVDFTMTGPVTPVLTGIPRGRTDNAGRIAFSPAGDLLVGTGDTGRPALAGDPKSLAGKVLRLTDIGSAAPGNPTPHSRVYASGFRTVAGLCFSPQTGQLLETEARPKDASDPINVVAADASYGWPSQTTRYRQPLDEVPSDARSPGGCAVSNGSVYVTSRDGQQLLTARLGTSASGATAIGAFSRSLQKKYGRLLTVVAAPDGALWLTTTNRDGQGTPVAADERVLRIVPSGSVGHSPV